MSRSIVAGVAVMLTAAACGSASAPLATPTTRILDGSGFSALFSTSWSIATRSLKGATEYHLSSHGSLSSVGLPRPGAIGITIGVLPFAVLVASGAPDPAKLTPAQLMAGVVGTPSGATGVKLTASPHNVVFAADPASGETYTYTSAGSANVQEDMVVRHGQVVYFVELDTEPTMKAQGESAVAALMRSWSWGS